MTTSSPPFNGALGRTCVAFFEAARVRTLPAGIAPVIVGAAIAFANGGLHLPAVVLALIGALAIQIGTNYANDYFDFKNGADTDARIGPRRATQAGLVSPAAMKLAFTLAFAFAAAVGALLVIRAGWPILVVGVLSIACGVLYTGGPRPFGYLGLGDALVLVFFGPVAVAGTEYVQSFSVSPTSLSLGAAVGCLSVAILVVNNLRDRDTDVLAHKRTLAVRFGARFARIEYTLAVAAAFILVIMEVTTRGPILLLPFCTLPLAIRHIVAVWKTDGAQLNPLLGKTGALLVQFSLLLALALVLATPSNTLGPT